MASFGTMTHKLKGTTVRFEEELAARLTEYMRQKGIRHVNTAVNMILHQALPQTQEKEPNG